MPPCWRSSSRGAVSARQRDAAAADQRDGLTDPVTRVGAGEQRVLADRIETGRGAVGRLRIAAGVKPGQPEAHPVEVDRRLGGGEEGADVLTARAHAEE